MPTISPRRALAGGATIALTATLLTATLPGLAGAVESPPTTSADGALLDLAPLGTHRTGVFDASAAEIVTFDPGTDRAFVVNAQSGTVDVLDASDPTDPTHVDSLAAAGVVDTNGTTIPDGAVANSIVVRDDGLLVVAIESDVKTNDGWLLLATADELDVLGAVRVGPLPDMVTLTPDGRRAVVANEGEPADDYSVDPEGSVAVVDLPATRDVPPQSAVRLATFHAWEADGDRTLDPDVRVFGPEVNTDRPVSANLEPEYVAVDPSGDVAYVALQEANAMAEIDLDSATVTEIRPLGFKDHSVEGAGLDPSDRDAGIEIGTWPVLGMYLPDGLVSYEAGGDTYLVTANEGDAREWGDYVEPARVKDLGDDGLAPICEDSPAADLTSDAELGRLNVSTAQGLSADGSCYEDLYAFGSRSFSIWTTDGEQVFDSGDAFERIVAEAAPEFFNSNHSESNFEGRSEDKGPEPENLAIGQVGDRTYAFVGFERVGGIATFDITDPADASFVTYVNNRDFSVSVEDADDPAAVLDRAGDLGPEGVAFVSAEDSPTGQALVAVGNEVSGTTTFFGVTAQFSQVSDPTIEGDAVVGGELTASIDDWSPAATFTYQWLRDGEPIDGATEATYEPVADDAGAELTVAVTGAAASHEATTRTSAAVTVEPGDGDGGEDEGLVLELDSTTVEAGGVLSGSVEGAAADEELTVTLFSDPIDLGTVTADASGVASLEVDVPASTPLGDHRLVIEGPSGSVEADVVVTAAVGGDSGSGGGDDGGFLPDTGARIGLAALAAALAMIAAGVALMRRRPTA